MIRGGTSRRRVIRAQQGFTIVEILIAAAIVATGLLAMVAMFPGGYSTVTKSGIQSTGLALAQQQIEYLRNQGYSNITLTTACPVAGPSGYTCTKTVTDNTPTTNAKQVAVTVTLPIDCPPDLRPCLPYGVTTPDCPDLTKRCIRLTTIVAW